MSMDKINHASLAQPRSLDSSRLNERIDTRTERNAADGVRPEGSAPLGAVPAGGDTAQISETAHRLMELRQAVDAGRVALESLPDVRQDKIAEARERLRSGFYTPEVVREKVAVGVDQAFKGLENL